MPESKQPWNKWSQVAFNKQVSLSPTCLTHVLCGWPGHQCQCALWHCIQTPGYTPKNTVTELQQCFFKVFHSVFYLSGHCFCSYSRMDFSPLNVTALDATQVSEPTMLKYWITTEYWSTMDLWIFTNTSELPLKYLHAHTDREKERTKVTTNK